MNTPATFPTNSTVDETSMMVDRSLATSGSGHQHPFHLSQLPEQPMMNHDHDDVPTSNSSTKIHNIMVESDPTSNTNAVLRAPRNVDLPVVPVQRPNSMIDETMPSFLVAGTSNISNTEASTSSITNMNYHQHISAHSDTTESSLNENNADIEMVVSKAIKMLHSVLDRIIQQDIIDPMIPIFLDQYHPPQSYHKNDMNSGGNEMVSKPSAHHDPNQTQAFLVS